MTHPSAGQPAPARPGPAPVAPQPTADPPAPRGTCCKAVTDDQTVCPACGDELHLWANYQRCRNCGYKESCCF